MKTLILAVLTLGSLVQAKTQVECKAVTTVIGIQASVPVPVLSNINDAALAGSSIRSESYALVIKASDEALKNKDLFVRMDARNKNIQLVGDLTLKAQETVKGTRILVKFEDRLTQQSNIYTMTMGTSLDFSVQNRSSQNLKISCTYGQFQLPGI
jgi:hypothetical protein